jgi:hypothetical protein
MSNNVPDTGAVSVTQPPQAPKRISFEEFKLYYESTEKVTDRRLTANNWNYTICVATLVGVAAVTGWGLRRPTFLIVAVIAIILLCVMAVLYCTLWIGQIRDFKALNAAKFSVLNEMAPCVCFSEDPTDSRVSYEPFEREWVELERIRALGRVRDSKILALRSSNIEFLIPKTFRVLFGLVLLLTTVISLVNRDSLVIPTDLPMASDSAGKRVMHDSLPAKGK